MTFPQNIFISDKKYKQQSNEIFARILKDYERTSDNHPRTGGLYWETTIPSIDYIHMGDYNAKSPMPDQFNRFDDEFIELKSNQQWLWMNVCCQATFGKDYKDLTLAQQGFAKQEWKSFTWNHRCFNNSTGREDGYTDYVLPYYGWRNIGMMQESIVCSTPDKYTKQEDWNIVKIIGNPINFTANYLGLGAKSIPHFPIEVLDVKNSLPLAKDLIKMKWLCHRPSTSTGKPLSTGYQINPFPQFQSEMTGMPESRYILWGNGTNIGYIRCDWVVVI
jgi:hypothetical protein